MKNTAQKNASTQQFINIRDIRENIVLLKENNACLIFEVSAVNFSLLSREEQDAKTIAYASLLNSLSFPIQILVHSKRVEIFSYVKLLTDEEKKTNNPKLKSYIGQYRLFVESMVKQTIVLDKKFYIVIPFSSLENGAKGALKNVGQKEMSLKDLFEMAKTTLESKADSLVGQITRLSLQAVMLNENQLIKLFYDLYNQGETPILPEAVEGRQAVSITTKQ